MLHHGGGGVICGRCTLLSTCICMVWYGVPPIVEYVGVLELTNGLQNPAVDGSHGVLLVDCCSPCVT